MNWNSLRPWLGTVVRLVLGVVWLWAGWSNLHDPRGSVQTIRTYDATPEWLSKAIGYGLPVLQVCLAALLIVGVAVRISAMVSGVLLVVFLIGTLEVAARGIKLDCGCFGGGGATVGSTHYLLDALAAVGLLALVAYLVMWSLTRISIEEFLARHDYVAPPSAKRMRTEHGMRKYNAMLETRYRDARERSRYINGALAIIVVLVSLIGIGVQAGRAKISGDQTAANASVSDGVVYGKKAAATVDIYEDFQCPKCQTFELAVSAPLLADVKANRAQVRYHPVAVLDVDSNGTRYSSRAANAALCASDAGADAFVKFHDVLFQAAVLPKQGSDGRTDAEFISYAQQAGLAPAQVTTFASCVQNELHKALVQAITEKASRRGVTAALMVSVNGTKLKNPDLASLTAAIAAADAKGPAPAPSPTASPSPSRPSRTPATASKSASPSAPASTKR